MTSWIPTVEKLPELEADVLISTCYENVETAFLTTTYDGSRQVWYLSDECPPMELSKVIAWMPLPKPYTIEPKGEKQNG